MTQDKYTPDLNKAEDSLIAAIDAGDATRLPFGHDALWVPARARRARAGGLENEGRRAEGAAPPSTRLRSRRRQREGQRLAYVPVRSASLDLTGCLKLTVDRVVGDRAA